MTPGTSRRARVALVVAGLLAGAPESPAAHEIPARVVVRAFVKPEPGRLTVLVRVPLEAMRDVEFPLRGEGYLDLGQAGPWLREAATLWVAAAFGFREDGRDLGPGTVEAARVALPSDRSFDSYEEARALFNAPTLPPETALVWQQALLDVWLTFPIRSAEAGFTIQPQVARLGLRTFTGVRFLPGSGAERVYQLSGDPGLVRLDPRWHHAFLSFVKLGWLHILQGMDHLLFVVCLILPFRRLRPLVALVTSFTVGHSVTLAAATLGLVPTALWFPPLVEMLIALSIVFMAFENIVGPRLDRRWVVAFAFGLVHGFGFSFFLRESLQFAGGHLAASLVAFNVGVELGQLAVVAVAVPALGWLFRRTVPERMGTILISALVAHSAWHWMTERWGAFREYRVELPALDPAFLAGAMRVTMLLLLVVGGAWLLSVPVRRLVRSEPIRQ